MSVPSVVAGCGRSVLYVGPESGTCLQRARALRDLGCDVEHLASELPVSWVGRQVYRLIHRLHRYPDLVGTNRRLLRAVERMHPDLIWIDKGLSIRDATMRRVREIMGGARLVAYSPDDMMNPLNQTERWRRSVPHYDLHVTTKSYNVDELKALGARDVLFVDNAYDPAVHRPIELTTEERERFGADVGFVGDFERERAETMLRLARAGMPVSIFGTNWKLFQQGHPLLKIRDRFLDPFEEYPRALVATRINLGFLKKGNRDLQTTRSIEIPACGAFMLAERTDEHLRLFREGIEAEFFSSFEELLEKCKHYLEHEDERLRIARAGLRRCIESGYSNQDRLKQVLVHIERRTAGSGSESPPGDRSERAMVMGREPTTPR